MNDSELRRLGQELAAAQTQEIRRIVREEMRQTSGVPAGEYGSFLWDGYKIIGAGAGVQLLALYEYSSGQNIARTTTRLNLDQAIIDTNGYVTTGSSWAFTAQEAGHYAVFVNLHMTTLATWIASTTVYGVLRINFANTSGASGPPSATGLRSVDRQYPDTDHDVAMLLHGWMFGYLNAGDTIYAEAAQQSGNTVLAAGTTGTDNSSIAILRVLL